MTHSMERICSWCNELMGVVECEPRLDGAASHGICPKCLIESQKLVADLIASAVANDNHSEAENAVASRCTGEKISKEL